MFWITFKEAYQKAGVHKTTAERRLKALRERQPELYNVLVDDSVSPRLVHDPRFVEFIKLPLPKVNKKKKVKSKTVTKKQKRIKPRKVTKETKDKIEDIWQEPVNYTMDEETQKLYGSLRTEAERIKFENAVKILELYVYSPLTLNQCCQQFGGDRHKFRRWCKEIEPIEHLYQRAKATRKREQFDEEVEIHLQNIRTCAEGYSETLKTKEYYIHVDIKGNEIRIPIKEKEATKHVSRNVRASIFWLTNKLPDEFRKTSFNYRSEYDSNRHTDPLIEEIGQWSDEELVEYIKENGHLIGLTFEDKSKD
ncbi:hypothetical protein [Ekhidna sp.]|uniref:hypothetical protein n=1 Tax=Ekhidna sp. TaxID=2608089 RepID=UPI00329A4705